jgi:RNA polymerase sigma-70 factor (ECF subfamily)
MGLSDGASDDEAIEATLAGDRDAFAVLVKRYERFVFRIGYGFHRDADEAADFAQEVFVKAFTKLDTFRHGAKFSTWLARIAYNAGINASKRGHRYDPISDPDAYAGSEDVVEGFDKAEAAALLRDALATLPAKQALCVDLFYFCGLKYVDIGEATGLPVNTVKSHVFRAKRALREALEGREARGA